MISIIIPLLSLSIYGKIIEVKKLISKISNTHLTYLAYFGIALTVTGSFLFLLAILNIIDVSIFGFGVTTGHRNLGGIAVFGTIVSAVSYGIIENSEEEKNVK